MVGDLSAGPDRWRRRTRDLALVTGASSGIGAAFALELADAAYNLVLVGRDTAALERTASAVSVRGGTADSIIADLAVEADLVRVEAQLRATPVDLLVSSAGTGVYGPFVDQTPAAIHELITVNVLAYVRLLRAALPDMLVAGHGGVICVSSPTGERAAPNLGLYGASKAFLTALDRTLQVELRDKPDVVVTTVLPGWTRTAFHRRLGQDVSAVPAEDWTHPERVASEALRGHRLGHRVVRVPQPPLHRQLRDVLRGLRPELADRVPHPVRQLIHPTRSTPPGATPFVDR